MSGSYSAFGGLKYVCEDGTSNEFAGKQASVLALLLVASPDSVSAERLIEQAWVEPPESSLNTLHSVISRLRSIVGDDLQTTQGGYKIEPVDFDIARFEAAARAGKHGEATSLWVGEPYPGLENLPTIATEIERLNLMRREAELSRVEQLIDSERAGETLADLARLAVEAPFDERAVALQMRALNASGQKREALNAFKRHADLLAEESGLEPSAQLRELELSILVDEVEVERPSRRPVPLDLSIEHLHLDDGRTIAVGRGGTGPAMIIHPGWLSKLDKVASGEDFRSPFWAELAKSFQIIIFDRVGTGLSSRDLKRVSLEASTEELIEVMEILDVGPYIVVGSSGAGPIAIGVTSARPELVSHLVLYGTYASGPSTFPATVAESMLALVRASWGMGSNVLASLIFPGGSVELREGFAEFQREAASPEVAEVLLRQVYQSDASQLLNNITTPTLVIHYRSDRAVPQAAGEVLAKGIRGARYMPLEGMTHYPLPSDFDRIVTQIQRFASS